MPPINNNNSSSSSSSSRNATSRDQNGTINNNIRHLITRHINRRIFQIAASIRRVLVRKAHTVAQRKVPLVVQFSTELETGVEVVDWDPFTVDHVVDGEVGAAVDLEGVVAGGGHPLLAAGAGAAAAEDAGRGAGLTGCVGVGCG